MIVLYVLENCPYCNNALSILERNNIKFKKIVVENTDEQKSFYKKQNRMNSFPQIFLQIEGNQYIKLGGNDNLIEILQFCTSIKQSNVSLDSIYYMYQEINKKK